MGELYRRHIDLRRRPLRLLLLAMGGALAAGLLLPGVPRARGQDDAPGGRAERDLFDGGGDESVMDDQEVDSGLETKGGQKVKVFRFSGLGLAGKLKSPQLLYFLNRMRSEFDRPRLPHRSFMPELFRSSKTKTF